MSESGVVIIGGGPCGIGAALRLSEHGKPYTLVDSADLIGGLARSFRDDQGFFWDVGGHVIFSHYAYFDEVMRHAVPKDDWLEHQRESHVWCSNAWVPYPFQNNIHRLPVAERIECLEGMLDAYKQTYDARPAHFEEYFLRQFGPGVARVFMRPYNFKVWAVPPKMMSCEWVGERVATADVKRVCRALITNTDDVGWGPNHTFLFPRHGGTGSIWTSLGSKLPQSQIHLGRDNGVAAVDLDARTVTLRSGRVLGYTHLISTMPFDDLLRCCTGAAVDRARWDAIADSMVYSTTHVIGIGLRGRPPPHLKTACWLYFPGDESPFYRATVFSNYSPNNAPEGCWSLMLEVSESTHKPVNRATLIEDCIRGCVASTLITEDMLPAVSTWHHVFPKGYPTPFLGRNALLDEVQPTLLRHGVYSRGRFGG